MAVKGSSEQTVRRLVFGSNVVLGVVIVWAIVLLVNFITAKVAPMPRDLTRGGQFSVSERTIKLLKGLDQKITLTQMYRVDDLDEANKQVNQQQKRKVEDLLRRYADISGQVSYTSLDPLKDTAGKTALIQRLIKQYSGDMANHKKAVDEFMALAPKLIDLLKGELTTIQKYAQADPKLGTEQNVVAIFYRINLDHNNVRNTVQDVKDLISGEDIPRYSQAVEQIQKIYQSVQNDLQGSQEYLAGNGTKLAGLPEDAKKFFTDSKTRYAAVLDPIGKQLGGMTNLPKLELEQIYDQVRQKNAKVILVEAEKSSKVKVLDFNDVWTFAQPRPGAKDRDKPQYDFNGEAAVSSAILALTAKERSAVIFVHAGQPSPIKPNFEQMRMAQPPYSAAKGKLEQANFVVEDWDLQTSPEPPAVPQTNRRLFVVVPSAPQRPQQPGMPPMGGYQKEHVERIKKLIDAGERMMFLVNFAPPIMGQPFAFAELLEKEYGVKADTGKLILKGMKYRDQVMPNPRIDIVRYDDFDITKPIQSLNTGMELAVPLKLAEKLPENVRAYPLITLTSDQGEFWAESNIFMLMQQRWAEKDKEDAAPPFNLAVAVENTKTKGKAVIFGNDMFATDAMANDAQTMLTAQGFAAYLVNPGNLELFTNSAFWLNDNENMISVGPRGADVPRIADISDTGQTAWKVFLWVVWPLGALMAGGVVYLFRRN